MADYRVKAEVVFLLEADSPNGAEQLLLDEIIAMGGVDIPTAAGPITLQVVERVVDVEEAS